MGISGLLPLLKSVHKPCNLKQFSGQTIGVDAYGWLHRGTISCAIDLALDKPTTKYVDFCMSRVRMLLHFGVTPYLVFDGDNLPGKAGTNKERRDRRKEAKKTGMELLKLGKTSQAHIELQKAVDVTPEMARMLIEELKRENIQYVVAPYEADSQLAYLEKKGITQGILSEDSDLLVFGAKCLITKLDQYGECVVIRRDDFTACREISFFGWSDVEFRRMAILSGCDYLPSISNMGLKTAHRLIRKYKTIDRVVRSIQFDGKFKVPADYLEAFAQAEMTFLYQWVFCPESNCLVNYTEPEPGINVDDLPYIGLRVDPDIATQVARGDLHPRKKEPIVLPSSHTRPARPLIPSRRQSMETPDLKKHKSIESFFKPKRTPLAELDPNIFTPSPSQRQLLRQATGSWSASPAPSRPRLNRSTTSVPASAPQSSRRATSDSCTRGHTGAHPAKRQRLCSDSAFVPESEGAIRVESGTSRFFASSAPVNTPSARAEGTGKKVAKESVNLWSDDSIEDAMAQLPDLDEFVMPTKKVKKKITIFADDTLDVTRLTDPDDSQDQGTSQSTVATGSSLEDSQLTKGTITPASSFGTLSAEETESQVSVFSAHLSAEVQDLRAKFSYQPPEPPKARTLSKQTSNASASRRTTFAPSRRKSVPLSFTAGLDPAPNALHRVSQSTTERLSVCESNVIRASGTPMLSAAVDSVPASPPVIEDSAWLTASGAEAAPASARAAEVSAPPPDDLPAYTPMNGTEDTGPDIEDAAWQAMSPEIVIPGSDIDSSNEVHTPLEPVEFGSVCAKGSEDFLVPESEGEEEETFSPKRRLDLGRFVFVPK